MEGDTMWHGMAPQGEEAEKARRELNRNSILPPENQDFKVGGKVRYLGGIMEGTITGIGKRHGDTWPITVEWDDGSTEYYDSDRVEHLKDEKEMNRRKECSTKVWAGECMDYYSCGFEAVVEVKGKWYCRNHSSGVGYTGGIKWDY